MKWILFTILFSVPSWAVPKLVLQDSFIFKVMGEIVSIKDLEADTKRLDTLSCYYSDSLVMSVFKDFHRQSSKTDYGQLVSKKPPFDSADQELFQSGMTFFKLKFYIQTQPVLLDEKYSKAIYLLGSKNKCDLSIFNDQRMLKEDYQKIFAVELFVRSRFIPERGGLMTAEQMAQAKQNVSVFVDSIARQIEDEIFWKVE